MMAKAKKLLLNIKKNIRNLIKKKLEYVIQTTLFHKKFKSALWF